MNFWYELFPENGLITLLKLMTKTQSLATSSGKLCVTVIPAHILLHHGLVLPVKDGVKHEVLRIISTPLGLYFYKEAS